MKNKLNLIVCFAAIFTLSSCHFFNDKEENKETNNNTPTVEGISQEIKNKIAAQDTLMNALVLKVDTLAQALTQAQKENTELKAQIEKLESLGLYDTCILCRSNHRTGSIFFKERI